MSVCEWNIIYKPVSTYVLLEPEMNLVSYTGFISPIRREAIFNDTPTAPKLFYLATFLSIILVFLSKSVSEK